MKSRRRSRDEQLLKNFKTFCVVCRRKIPRKRHRRHAITCSDRHQKRLTRLRKLERDSKKCSHCSRPVTPKQIAEFRAWKRSQTQDHAKNGAVAAKGIRAGGQAIHSVADFAYIAPQGRKRGTAKKPVMTVNGSGVTPQFQEWASR